MINTARQKSFISPTTPINMLSWNIQSSKTLEGNPKASDPEFLRVISEFDIVCLQETREPLKLANYVCFNKNRKSSKSGGVCIAISRRLASKCVYINKTGSEDIQVIRLNKHISSAFQGNDVILINVYNSPSNSSYKKKNLDKDDVLHTLGQLISDLQKPGTSIIVAGDLNARIGRHQEDENGLDTPNIFLETPVDPHAHLVNRRTSKDCVTNGDGKTWLDILLANCLVVLNGRMLGDATGDFTCLKYNGNSTIDYFAVSTSMLVSIDQFRILPFTDLSDHKPISACISLAPSTDVDQLTDLSVVNSISASPKSFRWDNPESFIQAQQDEPTRVKMNELNALDLHNKEDVVKLNDELINIFQQVACRSLSKKSGRRSNKNPWFDWDCRTSKRTMKRLCADYSKSPRDEVIRDEYYRARRDHKKLIKSKKYSFIKKLNYDIESGKRHIKWKEFKKLKAFHSDDEIFDVHDLYNFYVFFNNLYGNKNLGNVKIPPDSDTDEASLDASNVIQMSLDDCLNNPIDGEELDISIQRLKNNKSVSCDLISNEMLKSSGPQLRQLILKLFNGCLDQGAYPWNESITTPLHKKGDKQNPDNYRAITIGSCIGKLFASVLLKRVIAFRRTFCPDTPNQLGFCEGAQTADHILTLSTIIEKYVHVGRKRLYTCFIDFRKAFDSVNREALLYKLSHIGLQGKFLSCIRDMYTRSTTRIKLIQKLSERIDVLVGTEQGHPLSPEFFKIYIHELSDILNKSTGDFPLLQGVPVTHLLWADDLVIMALNHKDLNTLLNELHEFCSAWGLEVNMDKTKVMMFNVCGRLLKQPVDFKLGDKSIESTRSYCYLGIIFSLNGSFKVAQDELRKKALRSYFSMKRTIDINSLSVESVLKLFDSLVLPVLTYAIEVWFWNTDIAAILSGRSSLSLKILSRDSLEKVHMQVIKWTLGVHKRSSNIGCYGDTGRHPIGIRCLPQILRYFGNLEKQALASSTAVPLPLATLAFLEQRDLELRWYSTLLNIRSKHTSAQSHAVKQNCCSEFIQFWKKEKASQNKLSFYNIIKPEFGYEDYLSTLPRDIRRHVTRLRISAHTLKIETGRYNTKRGNARLLEKVCDFCTEKTFSNTLLHELPFFDPIIEDELHVLVTCPKYNIPRSLIPLDILSSLLRHDILEVFNNKAYTFHLGRYIKNIFKARDMNYMKLKSK